MSRICSICRASFEGPPQRLRCRDCSKTLADQARARRWARTLTERVEARGTSVCEGCGASFVPVRTSARFCSVRCRVAAHRNPEHGRPDLAPAAALKAAFAVAETPVASIPEDEQPAVALKA